MIYALIFFVMALGVALSYVLVLQQRNAELARQVETLTKQKQALELSVPGLPERRAEAREFLAQDEERFYR